MTVELDVSDVVDVDPGLEAGVDYDTFGPFRIHECLGAGGMAIVHRASIGLGAGVRREVALKRLLPQLADDHQLVQDFIREAKLSAQLQHPNIVKVVELGQVGREYFIAMELIGGSPLMKIMRRAHTAGKPAPIGVVLAILMELCDALDYAHSGTDEYGESLGIVHRDLSPSNLIVTDDGHIKVIDFGIAKGVTGKFMTNTGVVKGKLGYMSVEGLAAEPLDARADLYAAGVIAWELLTARRLFKGTDELDTIRRVRTEPVPRPSMLNRSCPGGLDALVIKALARQRDDRWRSAAEMRAALELVRRPYRDQSDAREVSLWKRILMEEPPASDPRRTDTDAETTCSRLASDDLEELDDDGPPVHELTMYPYDEPSMPSIEYVTDTPRDHLFTPPDPEVALAARSDTLDEPVVSSHEPVEPEHQTLEEESPWPPTRDTQPSSAVYDDDDDGAS